MIVVLVMLRNLRSSLLISSILPLGVLLALVAMRYAGVDANIMALGGIAIAIGTMVDMGIVFTENIVQHLDEAPADADRDGMPDAWEMARGLDPSDPGDAIEDRDGDGYTNLEERLECP